MARVCGSAFTNHHACFCPRVGVSQAQHPGRNLAVAGQRLRDEVELVCRAPDIRARRADRIGVVVNRVRAGRGDSADVTTAPRERRLRRRTGRARPAGFIDRGCVVERRHLVTVGRKRRQPRVHVRRAGDGSHRCWRTVPVHTIASDGTATEIVRCCPTHGDLRGTVRGCRDARGHGRGHRVRWRQRKGGRAHHDRYGGHIGRSRVVERRDRVAIGRGRCEPGIDEHRARGNSRDRCGPAVAEHTVTRDRAATEVTGSRPADGDLCRTVDDRSEIERHRRGLRIQQRRRQRRGRCRGGLCRLVGRRGVVERRDGVAVRRRRGQRRIRIAGTRHCCNRRGAVVSIDTVAGHRSAAAIGRGSPRQVDSRRACGSRRKTGRHTGRRRVRGRTGDQASRYPALLA